MPLKASSESRQSLDLLIIFNYPSLTKVNCKDRACFKPPERLGAAMTTTSTTTFPPGLTLVISCLQALFT